FQAEDGIRDATVTGVQTCALPISILRKRPAYRKAFDNFDARKIARYSPAKVRRLLADAGIVRHRGKIEATIANARAFLAARGERSEERRVGKEGAARGAVDAK